MEIEIISGFLGAGKTTFLNQYLKSLTGRTVVIENEFGAVGLDGALIREDTPVRELASGCICCTLATNFREEIKLVAERFHPDKILIEPSGVGCLSDVVRACEKARTADGVDLVITKKIVIVDAAAFEEYAESFGSFYEDQITHANLLLLSNIDQVSAQEKAQVIDRLRALNPQALLYEDDWRCLDEIALGELLKHAADIDKTQTDPAAKASASLTSRSFSSITVESPLPRTRESLEDILCALRSGRYGEILRAKGVVPNGAHGFLHFDYTLSGRQCRPMDSFSEPGGRVIVIGRSLDKSALRALFTAE